VRRALLEWFRRTARPLPWRKSPRPYQVWVSEVMLQQTQVSTVIPYYRRFLRSFPTLQSLARAPLERVMEVWSGMGYYRRARNLHRAARRAVERFGGRFPPDYRQARSLPGVGDYTARAILSIAYRLPYAVADGNVARVQARLMARRGHLARASFRRAVERELDRLLSRRSPGNFNQAMMELGQTVCLPRAPRCAACPLRRWCAAFRSGHPEAYPSPKPRPATKKCHLAAAVIRRRDRIALVRGLDDGLLLDLWNFPSAFGSSRGEALEQLRRKLARLARGPVRLGAPMGQVRHQVTFRSIRVHVCPAEVSGPGSGLRWFPLGGLEKNAISQLARKIARTIPKGGMKRI
jgi:A/G-specific adenine glycosylase